MVWIIAFALVAATLYTLMSVPDIVLGMWRGNKSHVQGAMKRLQEVRAHFGELTDFVDDYPSHPMQAEIGDVIVRVREVANPAIINIQALRNSDIWHLAILEDTSWSIGSREFWRYWRPIWQMRQDARLIGDQVAETERYVRALEALCDRMTDQSVAILPDDEEAEPELEITLPEEDEGEEDEEDEYADEDLQEIATAFKFSLRQESVSPVLDQIEGERAQGMQISELYERGLGLQQALAELEERAWEADVPSRAMLNHWIGQLEQWREEKEVLANEVEHIQRRRVEHERNVRRVETKIDEYVVREEESDLSLLAYDMLSLSDSRLEMLDWEGSADAIHIATAIANGLPNMRAIDQNARALKQRIPNTSGATRALLTQTVQRYTTWRALLDHAVTERNDVDNWLRNVRDDVTRAFTEKPQIIQLLNDAVIAQQKAKQDDAKTGSLIEQVWELWNKIDGNVTLDDHWLADALQEIPASKQDMPTAADKRTDIRNLAQKSVQALERLSTELRLWQKMIRQDNEWFASRRIEVLEPASDWRSLQSAVERLETAINTYLSRYQKPKVGWLLEKRDQLHKSRQTNLEKIRRDSQQLYMGFDSLQNEADSIRIKLQQMDKDKQYDAIVVLLEDARQADHIADARMALQSAKYALGAN